MIIDTAELFRIAPSDRAPGRHQEAHPAASPPCWTDAKYSMRAFIPGAIGNSVKRSFQQEIKPNARITTC
jgi:hypothetical protein